MSARKQRGAQPCGAPTIIKAKNVAQNFDGMYFYNNNFNGLEFIDCNLSECTFHSCSFKNCSFHDVCFAHSIFVNCYFDNVNGSGLDCEHSFCENGQFCPQSFFLFSTYGLILRGSKLCSSLSQILPKRNASSSFLKHADLVQCRNFSAENSLYYHSRIQPKIKTYFAKIKEDSLTHTKLS